MWLPEHHMFYQSSMLKGQFMVKTNKCSLSGSKPAEIELTKLGEPYIGYLNIFAQTAKTEIDLYSLACAYNSKLCQNCQDITNWCQNGADKDSYTIATNINNNPHCAPINYIVPAKATLSNLPPFNHPDPAASFVAYAIIDTVDYIESNLV